MLFYNYFPEWCLFGLAYIFVSFSLSIRFCKCAVFGFNVDRLPKKGLAGYKWRLVPNDGGFGRGAVMVSQVSKCI